MTLRHVYSTNNGMIDRVPGSAMLNEHQCAVAIGAGSDGRYSINVIGTHRSGYALVDRAELIAIRDAIARELGGLN